MEEQVVVEQGVVKPVQAVVAPEQAEVQLAVQREGTARQPQDAASWRFAPARARGEQLERPHAVARLQLPSAWRESRARAPDRECDP